VDIYVAPLTIIYESLDLGSELENNAASLIDKYNLIPLKLQRALQSWYRTYDLKLDALKQAIENMAHTH